MRDKFMVVSEYGSTHVSHAVERYDVRDGFVIFSQKGRYSPVWFYIPIHRIIRIESIE